MPPSLLAAAIGYAVGSVDGVSPGLLSRPTPCLGWDLAALLRHANDSLAALCEGIATGCISLPGPAGPPWPPACWTSSRWWSPGPGRAASSPRRCRCPGWPARATG